MYIKKKEMKENKVTSGTRQPSVNDIIDLLTLCLDTTFLFFTGKVYKQVHGTAIRSPVSVVVANLVMEDVEAPRGSGSAM